MKTITAAILLTSSLISCNQTHNSPKEKSTLSSVSVTKNTKDSIDTKEAKNWLIKNIVNYFEEGGEDMKSMTTDEYYTFKIDAMNVDLDTDGSLTQAEFDKKWSKKFAPETHPIEIGFLISGQDWSKIEIIDCNEKSGSDKASLTFHTILEDKAFEARYTRDIVVVKQNGKYLITDVLEYD